MGAPMKRAESSINVEMIRKLLEVQRVLVEKLAAVSQELETLASGGAGIGAQMKQATATWERLWCSRYAPGKAIGYVWVGTRDFPLMKRLLQGLGLEELEKRMGAFLASDEAFFVKRRHEFGSFVSTVNSHTAIAAPVLELTPPSDCRHRPRCASDQEHTKRRAAEMRTA